MIVGKHRNSKHIMTHHIDEEHNVKKHGDEKGDCPLFDAMLGDNWQKEATRHGGV